MSILSIHFKVAVLVKGAIDCVEFEHQQLENYSSITANGKYQENSARASLSWRLTGREKESIVSNIQSPRNQRALKKIKYLLDK